MAVDRQHLPVVAGPGDSGIRAWIRQAATIVNARTDAVTDTADAAISYIPTGEVRLWTGAGDTAGFLVCDGSEVSRATYSDLFAVIGTDYGEGDGSTTFNLPDIQAIVKEVPGGEPSLDTQSKLTIGFIIKT